MRLSPLHKIMAIYYYFKFTQTTAGSKCSYWLPDNFRINFRILLSTFKALQFTKVYFRPCFTIRPRFWPEVLSQGSAGHPTILAESQSLWAFSVSAPTLPNTSWRDQIGELTFILSPFWVIYFYVVFIFNTSHEFTHTLYCSSHTSCWKVSICPAEVCYKAQTDRLHFESWNLIMFFSHSQAIDVNPFR